MHRIELRLFIEAAYNTMKSKPMINEGDIRETHRDADEAVGTGQRPKAGRADNGDSIRRWHRARGEVAASGKSALTAKAFRRYINHQLIATKLGGQLSLLLYSGHRVATRLKYH